MAPAGGRSIRATAALVALLLGATQLQAQGEPLHWWEGAAALGGIAVTTLLDEGVQHATQEARSPTGDAVATVVRRMGQPEVFAAVPVALFVAGAVARRPALGRAGTRVAMSLLTAGVLVTATKFVVGRERPSASEEPNMLRPFSGAAAFPSGHATMAFALATSVADEIHRHWATVVLETAAAGTGWSRINDDKHWLSDVVAGAALGVTSAQVIEGRWSMRVAARGSRIEWRVPIRIR